MADVEKIFTFKRAGTFETRQVMLNSVTEVMDYCNHLPKPDEWFIDDVRVPR